MIGEHIGPYRLLTSLGGAAGAVHRATGPDGRDVAIRALPAGAAPDIARMREVRSPYVVDVLDGAAAGDLDGAGDGPDGGGYVVSRLVPGRPLADAVAERGPLAGAALHRTALGLAKAIAAIHDAGLAHGDLHPGTVLLVDDAPVVVDFGLVPGADPADDVRGWAAVVLFAAVDPTAVPAGLRPLVEAAASADRAARREAAELAAAAALLEPPPG
ncbi:protein kinase family protein, partial [Actinomadura sediminis]